MPKLKKLVCNNVIREGMCSLEKKKKKTDLQYLQELKDTYPYLWKTRNKPNKIKSKKHSTIKLDKNTTYHILEV